MSLFKYRALDAQGAPQNGTLEARDRMLQSPRYKNVV